MSPAFSDRVTQIAPYGIFEIAKLAKARKDALYLNLGEPDFTTPPRIREAAKRAIDEGFTHYTHDRGIPELREAIADKVRSFNGFEADPEREIKVTAGSQEALYITLATILRPGDEVIILEPYYPHYVIDTLLHGAQPVLIRLRESDGYAVNPEKIRAKLTARTKAIILNSPMNPLGTSIPEATLREIAAAIAGTGVYLVSDEAYERILYDGHRHFSPAAIPDISAQTVSIFSFSKTYAMTGWRVGYMIAPHDLLEQASKVHLAITGYVNSIAQRAALAALGCEEDVAGMVAEYTTRRELAWQALRPLGRVSTHLPDGAFYFFLSLQDHLSDLDAARMLIRDAGVVLTPGSVFGRAGEKHLRLSYAVPTEILVRALERIAAVFR